MLCSLLIVTAANAAQTEPITGLPLYPGAVSDKAHFPLKTDTFCGKTVKELEYHVTGVGRKAQAEWFGRQMPGAQIVRSQANGPIDEFLSADGKSGVALGSGDVVAANEYSAIIYSTYSPGITVKQLTTGRC